MLISRKLGTDQSPKTTRVLPFSYYINTVLCVYVYAYAHTRLLKGKFYTCYQLYA